LYRRSIIARSLFLVSVVILGSSVLVMILTRAEPQSILSTCPSGYRPRDHLLGQIQNLLTLLSTALLWGSVFIISSLIPSILPYVYREARDRCGIAFDDEVLHNYEMRDMGQFVSNNSFPYGFSTIMFSIAAGVSLAYTIGLLWVSSNRYKSRSLYPVLPKSEKRKISWYAKIWPWRLSLLALCVSIVVVVIIGNITRYRGYPLNMFYWNFFGSKFFEKTGLSKTGSLKDSFQQLIQLISVSAYVNMVSVYFWLMWIAALIWVCNYPLDFVGKVAQDFSIVLFIKALVSWVTVSPTPVSMLDQPDCYIRPHIEDDYWKWIFRFSNAFSCNDNMYSIRVVIAFVPFVILVYFIRYSGYVNRFGKIVALVFLSFGITCTFLSIIVTRYQYTADIHIGLCICAVYMLTQQQAYSLLFDRDRADVASAYTLLEEKVLPTLSECVVRLMAYHAVAHKAKGLQIHAQELHEIALLYKSVGGALSAAKNIPQQWDILAKSSPQKAKDD
jgi:hypothetical protein